MRGRGNLEKQKAMWGYALVLPSLVGIILFVLIPVVCSLILTFAKWDGLGTIEWIGFDNFRRLGSDPMFTRVMKNTVNFTWMNLLGIVPALILAVILNQDLPGKGVFRVLYFVPYITMGVAVAMVWRWMFDSEIGVINYLLRLVGFSGIPWLGSRAHAMPSVVLVSIWRSLGYYILLFLSGLQSIPSQLYEAATVDGANAWKRFRHITLPLLSPTTFFVLIVSVINSFQVFDLVFTMTGGGPARATTTIAYYIYTSSFEDFRMGYGSTLAWALFLIVAVITAIQFSLQSKWVNYDR